jgi:hypothetical protein
VVFLQTARTKSGFRFKFAAPPFMAGGALPNSILLPGPPLAPPTSFSRPEPAFALLSPGIPRQIGQYDCQIRAAFVLQLAASSPAKRAIGDGKKSDLRPEKAVFPSNSSARPP